MYIDGYILYKYYDAFYYAEKSEIVFQFLYLYTDFSVN